MEITEARKQQFLTVYIPDTRGVTVSRYGRGNLKIGHSEGIYTYSRLPGNPRNPALGLRLSTGGVDTRLAGTCPGATKECQAICYASRPVTEGSVVFGMWQRNSISEDVPPIPADCRLLRIHVSGDFTSVAYINNWIDRLRERPDVRAWAYTRSWRVPELKLALDVLRLLPNIQVFASMDESTRESPPEGWRVAWIDGDLRAGAPYAIAAHSDLASELAYFELTHTKSGTKSLICPEETKATPNCETCRFCIDGTRNDVTFLKH